MEPDTIQKVISDMREWVAHGDVRQLDLDTVESLADRLQQIANQQEDDQEQREIDLEREIEEKR